MDYDALVKGLRFALRDWKGREDRYHFPSINALTIAEAVDAIADLRARNDALVKAGHGLNGILGTAESNASGMPNWEFVSARINAFRAALAANREG